MLEKFLNKKVQIIYTGYSSTAWYTEKGIITKIDNDFIEIDNDKIIAIKYILTVKSL